MQLPSGHTTGLAGVLVDESGRRGRVLRLAGRAVSVMLLLWLGILALGALGLEPLGGGVPGLGAGPGRVAAPPHLPARIQALADDAPPPGAAAHRVRATAAQAQRSVRSPPAVRSAVRRQRSAARRPTLPATGVKSHGSPAAAPASQVSPGRSASAPGSTGVTPSGNATGGKSSASPGHGAATPPGQANGHTSTAPNRTKPVPAPQGKGTGPTKTTP